MKSIIFFYLRLRPYFEERRKSSFWSHADVVDGQAIDYQEISRIPVIIRASDGCETRRRT
jgi:hypothetical protein